MPKSECKTRLLEQLYLKLLADLTSLEGDVAHEDDPIIVSTDDFEFEVKFKKKRKLVLIRDE